MRQYEAAAYDTAQPIPLELPPIAGWKEIPVHENNEPLVALGPFGDYGDIFTSSIYAGEHNNSPYWHDDHRLAGSLVTQFVRAEVAEQLRQAQSLLPPNHYLIVLDSYRSLEVQGALYDHYLKSLRRQHPDWAEAALSSETQKYVSVPSHDSSRPSPHNTGGAVDLAIFTLPDEAAGRLREMEARLAQLRAVVPEDPTPEQEVYNEALREQYLLEMARTSLVRRYGTALEFGTAFDYGGPEAASNYLEREAQERQLTDVETAALNNRRLLYRVMLAVGLQAYPDEWWHFNSTKSQMGAKAAGLDQAAYGAVELSLANQAHETMRVQHREGVVRIQEGVMQGVHYYGELGVVNDLVKLNEEALRIAGDPRLMFKQIKATVIEPPKAA